MVFAKYILSEISNINGFRPTVVGFYPENAAVHVAGPYIPQMIDFEMPDQIAKTFDVLLERIIVPIPFVYNQV